MSTSFFASFFRIGHFSGVSSGAGGWNPSRAILSRVAFTIYPATLSPAIITGLLRQQLGYDGVVISDDMQMRAITDLFKLDRAFELAILAGVDIIAVANNVTYSGTVADRFVGTVHKMLEAGTIGEDRIEQSFQRIMRLKGLA